MYIKNGKLCLKQNLFDVLEPCFNKYIYTGVLCNIKTPTIDEIKKDSTPYTRIRRQTNYRNETYEEECDCCDDCNTDHVPITYYESHIDRDAYIISKYKGMEITRKAQ